MKRTSLIMSLVILVMIPVVTYTVSADTWVDVTEEVAANPLDKGGWTIDEQGKVFRSEDGNQVKIQHSEYGTYIVNLPDGKVDKIENDEKIAQKNPELLNRDGGMMLVVRTDAHKFRLRFSERVSGMQAISGIRGM